MAEQRWMRSPWMRIALGLVGVVAVINGLSQIGGGMRTLRGDAAESAQQAAVPGYGPPANANGPTNASMNEAATDPRAYVTPPNYAPANNAPAYAPQAPMSELPATDRARYQQPSQYPSDASTMPESNTRSNARWFRDPQGRYEIAVPAGWEALPQQGNLEVRNGAAYALLAPVDPRMTGEQIVSAMSRQYSTQWRGMQMVNQGQVMLSGASGAYVMLRGQNPRGVESLLRIAAASSNGQAWMFVISAPLQEFNQVSQELQQIETSFAVARR